MSITAGTDILASDFINLSAANATPSADAGRVAKLESDGKIHPFFTRSKFGGDGSDGALTVASGTTTIDLAGAAVVIKNYSSISITGTGAVAFINPNASGTIVIFKSQKDVTITSATVPAIDLRGIGSAQSTEPTGLMFTTTTVAGVAGATSPSSAGGGGGVPTNAFWYLRSSAQLYTKSLYLITGAGGGNGGTGTSGVGGTGGRGGGALLIQCGGALNFTGTINSSGQDATAGTGATQRASGGAGGGSAGMVVILYNSLTANTGTITAAGGAGSQGGPGAASSGNAGGGGGGAASLLAAGGAGNASNGGGIVGGAAGGLGAGAGGNSGGSGTGQATPAAGGGSMGGLVAANTEFY